ncbi:hypothetical protein ACQ4PT_034970 [Festuca glaucescens]
MAIAADWPSLTSELVGLIVDALLATGDVDCYVSLRAVCHHWRDATADPWGPDPPLPPSPMGHARVACRERAGLWPPVPQRRHRPLCVEGHAGDPRPRLRGHRQR